MTVKELEQRIIALEEQVKLLRRERVVLNRDSRHDWESTVDKFKNDEDILAVLAEAMKLREKERRAVRKRQSRSRQAST